MGKVSLEWLHLGVSFFEGILFGGWFSGKPTFGKPSNFGGSFQKRDTPMWSFLCCHWFGKKCVRSQAGQCVLSRMEFNPRARRGFVCEEFSDLQGSRRPDAPNSGDILSDFAMSRVPSMGLSFLAPPKNGGVLSGVPYFFLERRGRGT